MPAAPTKFTSGGFTLVELLVALTIMGMVLGLLMNSMSFSMRTVDAVQSRISAIESFHQSQRALRRQLQLALPLFNRDSENPQQLDFSADMKQLDFVAPVPGLAAGGGLYRISLRIEDDPNPDGRDGRLTMRYRLYLDTFQHAANDLEANEVILLENFSRAQFSFFDTLRRDIGPWSSDWEHVERLPDLVRLSVDFGDGADSDALDLIVAIKATSPSGIGES